MDQTRGQVQSLEFSLHRWYNERGQVKLTAGWERLKLNPVR